MTARELLQTSKYLHKSPSACMQRSFAKFFHQIQIVPRKKVKNVFRATGAPRVLAGEEGGATRHHTLSPALALMAKWSKGHARCAL
jgi:hypothetical protein